jgi:hypothetical protein
MPQEQSAPYSAEGSNIKHCDVNGDMMLLVGPDPNNGDQLGILVSSSVLHLASKPFRVMLSPQFKEGIELASGSVISLFLQLWKPFTKFA